MKLGSALAIVGVLVIALSYKIEAQAAGLWTCASVRPCQDILLTKTFGGLVQNRYVIIFQPDPSVVFPMRDQYDVVTESVMSKISISLSQKASGGTEIDWRISYQLLNVVRDRGYLRATLFLTLKDRVVDDPCWSP